MTLLILTCVAFIYFFGVDNSSNAAKKKVVIVTKQSKNEKPNERFIQVTCKVLEFNVYDADTLTKVKVDNKTIMAMYPNGFAVRVFGMNAAEIKAPAAKGYFANIEQQREFKKGFKQKAIAEKLLQDAKLEIKTICPDKYPMRIVCSITVIKNGKRIDYTDYMIKHAGAKEYSGKGEKRY